MKTLKINRKSLAILCAISAAILCGAARAEEPVGKAAAESAAEVEAEESEAAIVSGEFYLNFDSKYLSYGFVDNNEPILTPGGSLTFFDWVSVGSFAIFDITPYGKRAGYKNREWKAIEYHPTANIGHSFGPDDFDWLPTTVEFSFGFDYEYHPRVCTEGQPRGGDTQFWTFELSLPDLWVEPTFFYERDTMRDNGTYMNLELGHTFALIDGESEEDDPVLTLRPSVGQGFGNAQRVRAYAFRPAGEDEDGETVYRPVDKAGLMDTCVKTELTWQICEYFALSGYVAYTDFLFDRQIRHGARCYEVTGDHGRSWNFTAGVALTASF